MLVDNLVKKMDNALPYKFKFDYIVDRVCEFLNETLLTNQTGYYHLCFADLFHLFSCNKYDEQRDIEQPSKIINQLRRKRIRGLVLPLTCPCGHAFNIYANHDYSLTYIEYICLQLELGYNQWLAFHFNPL